MGGGKAVWPCRTVTPAASTAFLVHSLLTLPNPLVVFCCFCSIEEVGGEGFHKLEKIRQYRQACEQGKLGELDTPVPFFNWFHDEELIDTQAKRVPMKQVRVVGRVGRWSCGCSSPQRFFVRAISWCGRVDCRTRPWPTRRTSGVCTPTSDSCPSTGSQVRQSPPSAPVRRPATPLT